MSIPNDPYQQIRDAEREQRRASRKKKWAEREKSFWKAFLFTEDGKPKSGLFLYTFCLSFVLLGVYLAAFFFSIEKLTGPTQNLPVFWGNLIESLAASIVGLLLTLLLHKLLPDKRLMFGSYLWLALYAVASLITLLVILRGTGASGALFTFFGWFVAVPLALGLIVSYLLYRHDYSAPSHEEQPAWKQYTQRR